MLGFILEFQPVFIVCFLVCDAFAGRWDEAFSSEQKAEVLVVQEVVHEHHGTGPSGGGAIRVGSWCRC